MKKREFDSLFRLGPMELPRGEIEVLYKDTWYKILSGCASPEGGRIWAVSTEMDVRLYNFSLSDPGIHKFRGPQKLKLASNKQLEEWGVRTLAPMRKVFGRPKPSSPPSLRGRVSVDTTETLNTGSHIAVFQEEEDPSSLEREDLVVENGIDFDPGATETVAEDAGISFSPEEE